MTARFGKNVGSAKLLAVAAVLSAAGMQATADEQGAGAQAVEAAAAEPSNTWMGPDTHLLSVDLRDLARFHPEGFPEGEALLKAMRLTPAQFFGDGVDFSLEGAGNGTRSVLCQVNSSSKWVKKRRANTVYGVELIEPPVREERVVKARLRATIHRNTTGLVFREFTVELGGPAVLVTVDREVPAAKTHFQVKVGLLDRKAVLTDRENNITKIYPLGVGGFDEGINNRRKETVLITPLFRDALIDRNKMALVVNEPNYYCGMPFIPVITSKGVRTSIGFHIIQHPQMVRGFDSHGCMRLREKDLYELTALLSSQDDPRMSVNVFYRLSKEADHPYPLRDDGYQSVVDCRSPAFKPASCFERLPVEKRPKPNLQPASCRDGHGLLVMKDYKCRPPLEKLPAESSPDIEARILEGRYNDVEIGDLHGPEVQLPAEILNEVSPDPWSP